MKLVRIPPDGPLPAEIAGAVLVRDMKIGGARWTKGRRLSPADVEQLRAARTAAGRSGAGPASDPSAWLRVLLLDTDEIHEDEAGLELATVVAGPGIVLRGPSESRVDLLATADGVLHIAVGALERLNRVDTLEVFTLLDGQSVIAGELVGSVKIAPHAIPRDVLEKGLRIAARAAPIVRVAPFIARRVAVVSEESVHSVVRDRFETSIRLRVEGLGSQLTGFDYVHAELAEIVGVLRPLVRGWERVDVILTAGAASTDPGDPLFLAIEALGGRIVRHGAPAHPGSMAWLARIGATDLLGLPACGHYSRATAADLLLPRLLTGERASARMVAQLGHGGILTRSMRFRFPAYARALDAPHG